MIKSRADGLKGESRRKFLDMRVADFLNSPISFLDAPFVRDLSDEKNLELAAACLLQAHRK